MNQTEELVLKIKALKDMMAAAAKPFEAAEKRIRTWLCSMNEPDKGAEVDGQVKVYLQITKAKEILDTQALTAELESQIRRGRYTADEILDLLRSDILVVAKPVELAGNLATRIKGYVAPTTWTDAGKPESSPLRFNVMAAGRFEGLKDAVKSALIRLDPADVQAVLDGPLPAASIPAGQVAFGNKK